MRALGYNTWLYKYIAFIIAGFFAGISGMLFVHWNMLISPYQLGMIQSTYAVLCVILGGPGTLVGPVIGAAVVVGLEYGASLYNPERWPLILGIIFVISVMFLRGGLYPRLNGLWKKFKKKYSYGSTED
jgi:branched-chain amino acid transport system permease protein